MIMEEDHALYVSSPKLLAPPEGKEEDAQEAGVTSSKTARILAREERAELEGYFYQSPSSRVRKYLRAASFHSTGQCTSTNAKPWNGFHNIGGDAEPTLSSSTVFDAAVAANIGKLSGKVAEKTLSRKLADHAQLKNGSAIFFDLVQESFPVF